MILVALGSNRAGPWGSPEATINRALAALNRNGIRLRRASRQIVTSPFGVTSQAPFVNAVAEIATAFSPSALLAKLHEIERMAGRRRNLRWGPRTLDLDLLDYDGLLRRPPQRPILPHPGIAERIFVLAPVSEIAPQWRHPVSRLTAAAMLRRLDPAGEGATL